MTIVELKNRALQCVLTSALIALCCVGQDALATSTPLASNEDIDCLQEQDSMLSMKICAQRELDKTEKELKTQRQKMLIGADKEARKFIEAWFMASDAYAKTMCEVESEDFAGGSMQSLVTALCLKLEYTRQLKELKNRMSLLGGQ